MICPLARAPMFPSLWPTAGTAALRQSPFPVCSRIYSGRHPKDSSPKPHLREVVAAAREAFSILVLAPFFLAATFSPLPLERSRILPAFVFFFVRPPPPLLFSHPSSSFVRTDRSLRSSSSSTGPVSWSLECPGLLGTPSQMMGAMIPLRPHLANARAWMEVSRRSCRSACCSVARARADCAGPRSWYASLMRPSGSPWMSQGVRACVLLALSPSLHQSVLTTPGRCVRCVFAQPQASPPRTFCCACKSWACHARWA